MKLPKLYEEVPDGYKSLNKIAPKGFKWYAKDGEEVLVKDKKVATQMSLPQKES